VLGRRGHRYDELEVVEVPDDHVATPEELAMETHIHESYTAEGQGVLDVLACPSCGQRPGLSREMKRLGIWIGVLALTAGGAALLLLLMDEKLAAKAALVAIGFAIASRAYVFVAAIREATERVKLSPR
jgi:hypothetical protein